jgi:hypothetical protein
MNFSISIYLRRLSAETSESFPPASGHGDFLAGTVCRTLTALKIATPWHTGQVQTSSTRAGRSRGLLFAAAVVGVTLVACTARLAVAKADYSPFYWSSPITVDPGKYPTGAFDGIACPSTSLCVAVDHDGNVVTSTHPAAETSAWSATHAEGAATYFGGGAGGISCTSAPLCVAIAGPGDIITSTDPTGGADAWANASIDTAPLDGISCVSSGLCVAVDADGYVLTSTDPASGSPWTETHVDGKNAIEAVSCSSASLCVATDTKGNVLVSTDPLGEASAWTISHVAENELYSVSCVASELCLAGGPDQGQSVVSTNPTGGASSWSVLEGVDGTGGVSCATATVCIAGRYDTNGGLDASSDPTDDSSWAENEAGGLGDRVVAAVSCPSISLCVALDTEGNVFLGAGTHRLTVSLLGAGKGWVSSGLPTCPFESCSHPGPKVIEPQPILGVDCSEELTPRQCDFGFPAGEQVTLTETPATPSAPFAALEPPNTNSAFAGWGGACSGMGACTVSMNEDTSVSATFVPVAAPSLAVISKLHESHPVFLPARPSTALSGQAAKRRSPRGDTFSFTLDQAATVKIAIRRTASGRRSGHDCKPESRRLKHAPRCKRILTVATLTRSASAGADDVPFTGRIDKKVLKGGRYTAVFSATDAAGTSTPRSLGFRIASH